MGDLIDLIKNYKKLIPTFKNAMLYFGGSVVQLFISVFTSPIFARHLSAEEFGIIGYFASVKQFVLPLTTLTLPFFYLYKYFKQDTEQNSKLLSNLLQFLTLFNIISLCLSYGILYLYFIVEKITIPFYPFALIMILTLFIEVYQTFLLIDLKLKKQALTFFVYSSVLAVLTIAISMLMVVSFGWGAEGRMFGTLVSIVIVTVFFYKNFNIIKLSIDFKVIKEAIWWAFPMILSAYFYIPLTSIDRILLAPLNNTSELGYYSIGSNLAGYISTAALAVYSAFQPDLYKYVAENNKKKFLFYAIAYSVVLAILTILFFIFSMPITSFLTSGRYTRAYIYANYFAVSIFIMNLTQITNTILIALGKSRSQLYINIIAGTVGFLFYKYFINLYGFMGANYGRIAISCLYLITQVGFIAYIKYMPKLIKIEK